MCGDLLLKFLKLYQKFRVLTERLLNMKSVVDSSKEGSIILEIFDSEKANLDNDDISFYISLRPLN